MKLKKKSTTLIPLSTGLVLVILAMIGFLVGRNLKKDNAQPSINLEVVEKTGQIPLPTPLLRSQTSIESALKSVRPKRSFSTDSVSLEVVSQLLWSAQGVTVEWGDRTTPSAKSAYPLTVYLVANNIDRLNSGLYEYIPGERQPVHALKQLTDGQYQDALFNSLNQNSMRNPAGVFIVTGDMAKMAEAYGGISHDKEVYLEAGHATQNLYLQAESLKIGMVALSSFDDSIIRNIINIPEKDTLIYLIPFGQIKE